MKEYIDYVCSWGPGILGHADERVIDAVTKACQDGLTFGAPTRKEYEIAQLISELIPSMEMSRMVSSGALTQSVPDSAGVPAGYTQYTLIANYNDLDSVVQLFDSYKDKIAAVVVEPVAANMGVVLPQKGFLEGLRKITKENGSLLIFDEVITGFRLSLGGAQEYYNVIPDITTLGKIVGGGMPVGAYGGRKEIMECVAPVGKVYQAGTLSGNPIAMTAGLETLKILKEMPDIYTKLEKTTEGLADGIRQAGKNRICVNQVGSLMSVFFTETEVIDFDTAVTSDIQKYAVYFRYMLSHGVNLAPSQFEAMFLSVAHTTEDIQQTLTLINNYAKESMEG